MSTQPASDRRSRTILCIDDNRFGLAIRKVPLEARGFNVLTASSGRVGLAVLDRFRVDAVLLDYKAEGMDGEAVATQIRRKYPGLPIVLLSGYLSEIPERLLRIVDTFLVRGQPVETLLMALEAVTAMQSVTDRAKTLNESQRLVKAGRQLIAQNKGTRNTQKTD